MYKVTIDHLEQIKKHLQEASKDYNSKALNVSDEKAKKLARERNKLIKMIDDEYLNRDSTV